MTRRPDRQEGGGLLTPYSSINKWSSEKTPALSTSVPRLNCGPEPPHQDQARAKIDVRRLDQLIPGGRRRQVGLEREGGRSAVSELDDDKPWATHATRSTTISRVASRGKETRHLP